MAPSSQCGNVCGWYFPGASCPLSTPVSLTIIYTASADTLAQEADDKTEVCSDLRFKDIYSDCMSCVHQNPAEEENLKDLLAGLEGGFSFFCNRNSTVPESPSPSGSPSVTVLQSSSFAASTISRLTGVPGHPTSQVVDASSSLFITTSTVEAPRLNSTAVVTSSVPTSGKY